MIGIPNFLGYNCYITSVIQIIIRIPEYWFAVADTLRIMKENQSI